MRGTNHQDSVRLFGVGVGLFLMLGASPAIAATFTVTRFDDVNDGACDASCSLREAVRAANANPGPDTIVLPAGDYLLSIPGLFEEAAVAGDLDVVGDLTVRGTGRNTTFVYGIVDRVFDVLPGGALTLTDVTLTSGNPSPNAVGLAPNLDAESGGAIKNRGTLTLADADVINSAAFRARGGGIFNAGTARLTRVEVAFNQAGALLFGFPEQLGGGIYNSSGGTLDLVDSTIGNNSAFRTGGLYNAGIANFLNTTVSANARIGIENGGTLTLDFSTVSDNTPTGFSSGPTAIVNSGTATISSSILSSPFVVCGGSSPVSSLGHNVVSDASCAMTTGDQSGVDPQLKPLGDWGGPTRTALILAGSPAVDAGSTAAPEADQRGRPRVDGAPDSGATERQDNDYFLRVLNVTQNEGDAGTTSFVFTVRLDSLATVPVRVGWEAADGTATAPGDYQPASGRVEITPGTAAQTFQVDVNGDAIYEPTEHFFVRLSNPVAAQIEQGEARGEIINDDAAEFIATSEASLEAALVDAQFLSGPVSVTIHVRKGVYNIGNTIGSLHIAGPNPITLLGEGAGSTILDGNLTDTRVVNVIGGDCTQRTIRGVTVQGGDVGIYNNGTLVLEDSDVRENRYGIATVGCGLAVSGSTIRDNHEIGIYVESSFSAINTTVAGNGSDGISVNDAGDGASLTNVTLAKNDRTGLSAVFNDSIDVANTIIANNGVKDCDTGSLVNSNGHNLSSDTSCSFGAIGDLAGLLPQLGPLQANGGPTPTMALLPASPAVDAGDNMLCLSTNALSTDQRGIVRPADGNRDGLAFCDIGAFELDGPPSCSAFAGSVNAGGTLNGHVVCSDPDPGASFTVSLVGTPAFGLVTMAPNGDFTYTASPGFVGQEVFSFRATDQHGSASNPALATIEVRDNPPICADFTGQTPPGIPLNGSVTCSDRDFGDTIEISVVDSVQHGTLRMNGDGTFTYAPEPGFKGGPVIFTYRALDSHGELSNVATGSIAVGHPPVCQDRFAPVIGPGEVLSPLCTDPDAFPGDPFTVAIVTAPRHGSVEVEIVGPFTHRFLYTRSDDFLGTDSFTYQATDVFGARSNIATVTLEIYNTPVGAPVAVVLDGVYLNFSSVSTRGVTTSSSSTTGPAVPNGFQVGSLYYEITTTATHGGVFVCLDTGVFPIPADLRMLHFEGGVWRDVTSGPFSAFSRSLCGFVHSLSPFVLGTFSNRPPTASVSAPAMAEATSAAGASVTFIGSGGDPDAGDTLTYSWTAGGVPVGSTPTITVTLPLGAHDVTLTVTDSHGATAAATVRVVVRDTTMPRVTATPSKATLWPPNGKSVLTVFSGVMTDSESGIDPASAVFHLVDEYGELQAGGPIAIRPDGSYSFTVMLDARRRGQDRDTRRYEIVVEGADRSGNRASAAAVVVVPHDRR